ncbi:MAG TPA: hypothetical protein VE130_04270 [Nitrososphaeraceae archaeon]|nr:hypothetical protein [Nitrososphaeraceae archaeon]
MNLGKKKIKIEMEDEEGGKYNLSLEGSISKTKILKLYEFMSTIDGKNRNYNADGRGEGDYFVSQNARMAENRPISVGDKIWSVVANKFNSNAFTSSDIQEMFEAEYVEPIQLSIISTYLSRYSEKGKLTRIKKGKEWVYRLGNRLPANTLFRRDQPFEPAELHNNIAKSTEVN